MFLLSFFLHCSFELATFQVCNSCACLVAEHQAAQVWENHRQKMETEVYVRSSKGQVIGMVSTCKKNSESLQRFTEPNAGAISHCLFPPSASSATAESLEKAKRAPASGTPLLLFSLPGPLAPGCASDSLPHQELSLLGCPHQAFPDLLL